MSRWMMALAMTGLVACGEKPTEEKPQGEGAKMGASGAASTAAPAKKPPKGVGGPEKKRTLTALDAIPEMCGELKGDNTRLYMARCRKWRSVINSARGAFDRFERQKPETHAVVYDRLDAAVERLGASDPRVQEGARMLLELGLKRLRYQPGKADERYQLALVERVKATEDDHERVLLFRMLTLYASDVLQPALMELAAPSAPAAARVGAIEALARCTRTGCAPPKDKVAAWYDGAEGPVKIAILGLAGRIGMADEVLRWCPERELDAGCRLALRRLDHPEAFNRLAAQARGHLEAGRYTVLPESIRDLMPHVDRLKDRTPFFALLKRSLEVTREAPGAFASIAELMRLLKPFPETVPMAVAAYKEREKAGWRPEGTDPEGLAMGVLQKTVKALGAGKAIGLKDEGHNHKHGSDHGHSHGSHDSHDHGKHDHGSHDHGNHDHGSHDHGDHGHGDHGHGDHGHGDHGHGDHGHGSHDH